MQNSVKAAVYDLVPLDVFKWWILKARRTSGPRTPSSDGTSPPQRELRAGHGNEERGDTRKGYVQ